MKIRHLLAVALVIGYCAGPTSTGRSGAVASAPAASGGLSGPQIAAHARAVGLPEAAVPTAVAVALAESSGRTDAVLSTSREHSVGLWQINTKAHPQYSASALRDPAYNARAMAAISAGGTNWKPWATYTNGKYRQFL